MFNSFINTLYITTLLGYALHNYILRVKLNNPKYSNTESIKISCWKPTVYCKYFVSGVHTLLFLDLK